MRRHVSTLLTVLLAAPLTTIVGAAGVASAPGRIPPPQPPAALTTPTKQVIVGDWIKFTGTTTPGWMGGRARVERRTATEPWAPLKWTRVSDEGTIRFRVRATDVGAQRFRLVMSFRDGRAPQKSTSARVTVLTWYHLGELAPVATEIEGEPGGCTGNCTGFHEGAATIAGSTYPESYLMRLSDSGTRSTSTWNASGRCTTFEATLGLTDASEPATAAFTIDAGGDDISLASTTTGTAAPVTYDLRGVSRFTLAVANQGPGAGVVAALGDARLLCSARP